MKKVVHLCNVIFYAINIFIAMLLLATSLFSYIKVQVIPLFSFLSLAVPILFIVNFFFFVYWLFKRKKKFVWSFLALLVGYIVFGSFYKIKSEDVNHVGDSHLKIMTYNTWGFNKNGWIKEPNVGDRIIEFIKDKDPDIVCIQEHSRIRYQQLTQYPYRSETAYPTSRSIQAIFSKHPIVGNGSLDLPGTINNIIYADIKLKTDTIRVYNFHLQSFNIVPSSETFSEEQSEKNYRRLVNTFAKQLEQAKIFKEHRSKSPYRSIVCGDMNNTQFSNVYRILKDDMFDTFIERGKGFGRTYNLLGFPLRIDYVMADSEFEIISHQNFDEKLSDHYPVMATLQLKSKQ
ncbi:MAG: endonuclease/exonuclease/phosphatase family protein [Allomuricauda sp.]